MRNPFFVALASLAALVLLTRLTLSAPTIDLNHTGDNSMLTLTFLGSFEGKDVFIEREIAMSWTDAGRYCKLSNLELLEVENEAEANFLKEALSPFVGLPFWTATRERRTLEGFVWNGTNTVLDNAIGFPSFRHMGGSNYTFCGMIDYLTNFYAYPCNYAYHVLCQSKSPIGD